MKMVEFIQVFGDGDTRNISINPMHIKTVMSKKWVEKDISFISMNEMAFDVVGGYEKVVAKINEAMKVTESEGER
jgi:hypothetical protein